MSGKIVVTGAAGFIGANLVRSLLKKNFGVRAIDNVSRGASSNLTGLDVDTVHADLRDYEQAKRTIGDAESVYHLAARVGSIDFLHGDNSIELETLQSNVAIDTNVFRACRENGVGKIVYASSVSVYPIAPQQGMEAKFSEGDLDPISPEGGYGWAKLIGEIQLDMMENCKSATARIFNAYGEYCEFGKTAQVVPALVRKAINYPKEEFVVWGDGTQTRNLIYIDDCVDSLIRMGERASFPPLKLNIGSTQTVTIRELAETVIKVSGKQIPLKFDTSKPVGPRSRIPIIERARKALDWEPKTSLEEGIRRTFDWMSTQSTCT
jgi:GDP-D-mannose 3', 5'-epimerase